jgi:hypothetical protein
MNALAAGTGNGTAAVVPAITGSSARAPPLADRAAVPGP